MRILFSLLLLTAWSESWAQFEFKWQEIPETPDVANLTALDDDAFFIAKDFMLYDTSYLYIGDKKIATPDFHRIHKLATGAIVASTWDSLYISPQGDGVFQTYDSGSHVRNGVVRDGIDVLYIFRYDGIWQSTDGGYTWTHECPSEYFPAFDVIERTVQPTTPKVYFGMTGDNNIMSFDHGKNTAKLEVRNSNNNFNKRIDDFAVTQSGRIYYTLRTIATGEVELRLDAPGQPSIIPTPVPISSDVVLYSSFPLVYNDTSIWITFNNGEIWGDYTANLPDHVKINTASVGRDNTIYLGCQNGNVYKSSLVSGNKDVGALQAMRIFPNPASDLLVVELESTNDVDLVVYAAEGTAMLRQRMDSAQTFLDVSDFLPGWYVIKAENAPCLPAKVLIR